ncbi:hypothetical protein [Micromonospora sp. BQ11]|uniref:hypothetical protein n=1 Tax=Micromonospora sp. BQ11 TaxID=3452212 RepID=UPI003F891703
MRPGRGGPIVIDPTAVGSATVTLQALAGLRALGEPVPAAALRGLPTGLDGQPVEQGDGPPFDPYLSWLGLRTGVTAPTGTGPVLPDTLAALEARTTESGGFAQQPGGPADPSTTVHGLRLTAEVLARAPHLRWTALRDRAARSSACPPAPTAASTGETPAVQAALPRLAEATLVAQAGGRRCPTPPAVARRVPDLAAAVSAEITRSATIDITAAVTLSALLNVAGSHEAVRSALRAALAVAEKDPAGTATTLGQSGIVNIIDSAHTAGVPLPAAPGLVRWLRGVVRWQGRLPDTTEAGDLGAALPVVHTLTASGVPVEELVDWSDPDLAPGDRVLLAVATAPDLLSAIDLDPIAVGSRDAGDVRIAALGLAAAMTKRCSTTITSLLGGRIRAAMTDRTATAVRDRAAVVHAAQRCDMTVRDRDRRTLAALLPARDTDDVDGTLARVQAACLLASPPVPATDLRRRATESVEPVVTRTGWTAERAHALLALDQHLQAPCSTGWWNPASR